MMVARAIQLALLLSACASSKPAGPRTQSPPHTQSSLRPIDLGEYGRDPAYERPVQPKAAITSDDRLILDELERVMRIFATERPLPDLAAQLGTIKGDGRGPVTVVASSSPGITELTVTVGRPYLEQIEVRLRHPIAVSTLVDRFGELKSHEVHEFGDDFRYGSEYVDHGGVFLVGIVVQTPAPEWELPKLSTETVYVWRTRKSK